MRLAAGHYQFEAIHPFDDGNRRTGRILNLLFLVEQGLLASPVLYLSRAIIRNKADYYRLLLEVTTRDAWEPWVLYMLEAIGETACWTTGKIRAMRELLHAAAAFVRDRAPKIYSRELVDVILPSPTRASATSSAPASRSGRPRRPTWRAWRNRCINAGAVGDATNCSSIAHCSIS